MTPTTTQLRPESHVLRYFDRQPLNCTAFRRESGTDWRTALSDVVTGDQAPAYENPAARRDGGGLVARVDNLLSVSGAQMAL
jgi:hypothetical protein